MGGWGWSVWCQAPSKASRWNQRLAVARLMSPRQTGGSRPPCLSVRLFRRSPSRCAPILWDLSFFRIDVELSCVISTSIECLSYEWINYLKGFSREKGPPQPNPRMYLYQHFRPFVETNFFSVFLLVCFCFCFHAIRQMTDHCIHAAC